MTAANFTERLESAGYRRSRLPRSTTVSLAESNKTEDRDGRPLYQHKTFAVATRLGLVTVSAFRSGRFEERDDWESRSDILGRRYFVPGPSWRLFFSIVTGLPAVLISSKPVKVDGHDLRQDRVARMATTFAAWANGIAQREAR